MFDPNKTDAELGRKVEANLVRLGLQTPTTESNLSRSDVLKIDFIKHHVREIMLNLGLNLKDDSLADTPSRVAKMFVRETMWGLIPENFPKITLIDNKMKYDQMLVEKDISVMSQCEHHFVTIEGRAHVAYIPKDKVVGLSKLNRVVEYFSRRPQVQERLTSQILETLKFILDTDDVAVVLDGKHYCVISRGVQDENSHTITSALSGKFKDEQDVRKEFLSLVKV